MALFRKKTAQVIRRGDAAENRNVRRVGNEEVVVRKFSVPVTETAPTDPKTRTDSTGGSSGSRAPSKSRGRTSGNGTRARRDDRGAPSSPSPRRRRPPASRCWSAPTRTRPR